MKTIIIIGRLISFLIFMVMLPGGAIFLVLAPFGVVMIAFPNTIVIMVCSVLFILVALSLIYDFIYGNGIDHEPIFTKEDIVSSWESVWE